MKKPERNDLERVDDYRWQIPSDWHEKMRVPARIYSSERMLDEFLNDRTLSQLIQVAMLPGIVDAAMVMPDGHEGYGFPIGGVAAFDLEEGIISPGGIGYDINCGVRVVLSNTHADEVNTLIPKFTHELTRNIPRGMGRGGKLVLSREELKQVLLHGAGWAVKNGYGLPEDLATTESNGRLPGADPDRISDKAFQRGYDQLGTLGAGNHFVEIDRVDEIVDPKIAEVYGLFPGQLVVMIHTGSRGLGHQTATDYLRRFLAGSSGYGFELPDRELACAPLASEDGKEYLSAMAGAANFAWCNRQMIMWAVRNSWEAVTGRPGDDLQLLYDVAHNIAKVERHNINGRMQELVVHRKGATRAFGRSQSGIPEKYESAGQPVLIPGSMGTWSWILAGADPDTNDAFGSCCHGAGRRLSRTAAKKQVDAPSLKKELETEGITVEAGSWAGLAEEAPLAYKDVTEVVDTVHEAGLARKVARLRPVGVIKG